MFLKRVPEELYYRKERSEQSSLRLRYLGTAGFVIEGSGHTLVLDPFITRPSLLKTAFQPLVPNEELIRKVIPHADDVVIGHSHHDHLMDGPSLCHQTGARLIGSPDTCQVGRAAGLPEEQLVETIGQEDIQSGPATLKALPSLHGRVYFNRVTLPGNITEPPPWPARFRDLRHGLVLNWHIQLAGYSVVHIDTADYIDEELEGLEADVLCLCAIGRKYRPNYVKTAVEILKPKFIVPCHWDWFFTDYHAEPKCLPGVNLAGFLEEIRAEGVEPILLPFDGCFELP